MKVTYKSKNAGVGTGYFSKSKPTAIFIMALFFIVLQCFSSVKVGALSAAQNQAFKSGVYYFNTENCGTSTNTAPVTPGSGSPDGSTFPSLDPTAMANAINIWITQQNPSSTLAGLGSTIVASAKNSNINPFLIVAIADKETSMADPNSYDVKYANNSFGRQATASQPNYPGAGPNAGTLWYKWSSVEASVDYTAPENQNASGGGDIASYLRDQYPTQLASGSLLSLISAFAPPSGNNTAQYDAQVTGWINDLVTLTGGTATTGPTSSSGSSTTGGTGSGGCCNTGGSTTLSGNGNAQQAFNFFVGQGLNAAQSAGIVGNFVQESGVSPTETNSIGAHGIAQWHGGRLQNLIAYAQKNNESEDALSTQLNFSWQEFNTSYTSVLQQIKSTSDVSLVTGYVFNVYEDPGDNSLPARIVDAQQILQQYGGAANTASTTSPTSTANGSCGSAPTTGSGTYQNPLRSVTGLVPERMDQGVDYAGTGPIYAMGNGVVNGVYPNWYLNEPFIAYTLSDGPAAGKTVYFAECITPEVTAGQQVTSNTVIGQMTNCGNGIETGWANTADLPDSMARFCWDNVSSEFGVNFSQFLQSVGAPGGVPQEANPPCTLASGWPTW